MKFLIAVFGCWLLGSVALSHAMQTNTLQLSLNDQRITGTWDAALADLNTTLSLDTNRDGQYDPLELRSQRQKIVGYLTRNLSVKADGAACALRETDARLEAGALVPSLLVTLEITCLTSPKRLEVRNAMFFETNPAHRGFMALTVSGETFTGVFIAGDTIESFTLEQPNFWRQLLDFVRQGVTHIWEGLDHILFLLALLLPAVLQRQGGLWLSVTSFRSAFFSTLKVVTAFSVAHSITLALAALNIVSLPGRFVEIIVAASIIVAAVNNIVVLFNERQRWVVAFGFGLIHGFAFSNVLSELLVDRRALVSSLLGFNIGVELGQLAIVVVFLPLAFFLRATPAYRRVLMTGGSVLTIALAAIWVTERLLDIKLLPI